MITSKHIVKITEDWFKTSKNSYGVPYTVYVNPTSTDCKELSKSQSITQRFIADDGSQKVYVVDDRAILHFELEKLINVNVRGMVIEGYSALRGGKLVMTYSDSLKLENLYISQELSSDYKQWIKKLATTNWIWCNRYVDVSEFINKLKVIVSKW